MACREPRRPVSIAPLVPAPSDPAAIRTRAAADGYLYFPALLPPERLAPLRAVVETALARRGWEHDGRTDPALRLGRWDDPRWIEFLREVLSSDAYRALATAAELLAALRHVVGDAPALHVGDVCRLVSPGAIELTTPPHQDAAYITGADTMWTAWFGLGPCPRELGPLAVWRGSHHAGLRPHAPITPGGSVIGTDVPDDVVWDAADLGDGDVILFSAFTIHRALPNVTADRLRVSVDYRYTRAR